MIAPILAMLVTLNSTQPALSRAQPHNMIGNWFADVDRRTGVPFQGDIEERWVLRYGGRKEVVREGRIFVDAAGRHRVEVGLGIYPLALVVDPLQNLEWTLDMVTGELLSPLDERDRPTSCCRESEPEVAVEEPNGSHRPQSGTRTSRRELIGDRKIEGLLCRGYRRRVSGVARLVPRAWTRRDVALGTEEFLVETWTAVELGQVVLEKRSSEHENVVLRLRNIRREAPDPALFVFPGHKGQ